MQHSWGPSAWSPRSANRETTAVRSPRTPTREQLPLSATREHLRAARKIQHSQKNPLKKKKNALSHKKRTTVPFAATRTDLETVILSEVRENQVHDVTYVVESKQMVQMNLFTKQSHRCRKQTWLLGKKEGRDKSGDWDWHIHFIY